MAKRSTITPVTVGVCLLAGVGALSIYLHYWGKKLGAS